MNTLVCIKSVPNTSEAEIKIDSTGKAIEAVGLNYDINEADNYAVEEAILIKEALGGGIIGSAASKIAQHFGYNPNSGGGGGSTPPPTNSDEFNALLNADSGPGNQENLSAK